MVFNNSFSKNLDLLHRSLDVSVLRYNVIANNIANSETPNFKRSKVNFEAELMRALDAESPKRAFPVSFRYNKEDYFFKPGDYRDVKPRVVLDYLTTAKNNGNNVDIDEEMMNAMTTQLMYQAMLYTVNSEFHRVNLVLR